MCTLFAHEPHSSGPWHMIINGEMAYDAGKKMFVIFRQKSSIVTKITYIDIVDFDMIWCSR